MGQTMLGGVENKGNLDLLTPEQQQYLSSAMSGLGQMGQEQSPEQFNQLFQKSFVDPAQQMMQRQIIPGIKEQFMGMDESGSSALNQALSQAATDLSSSLGSQLMNQYNIGQNRQLGALQGLGGLAGQKTFEPMIQQRQGILGPLIGALGQIGSGGLMNLLTGSSQQIPGKPVF